MPFNSREYEWSDVSVSVLGLQLKALRGLVYKKHQEKEHVYAAGSNPHTIQHGNKKYDGTLTVLKSDLDDLNGAARSAGYEDITGVRSKDIVIKCVYEMDGQLKTDTLVGCSFTEYEEGMKTGDKFKEHALPFLFLKLVQA